LVLSAEPHFVYPECLAEGEEDDDGEEANAEGDAAAAVE